MIRLAAGKQPNGGDRAEALERAFESLWHHDLERADMLHEGVPEFSTSFLSLAYDHGQIRHGMPLWIVNGTDLTGGGRMLTAAFGSRGDMAWPFRATGDVLGLLGADVAISTAINNGARFPFLEPPGELISVDGDMTQMRSGRPEVLDGGYYDNEGFQTALELADWLGRQNAGGRRIEADHRAGHRQRGHCGGHPRFDRALPGPSGRHAGRRARDQPGAAGAGADRGG